MQREKTVKKKKKGKILLAVLGGIVGVIALATAVGAIFTHTGNKRNMELVTSFSAVDNPDAVVPQRDDDGSWSFVTDRDLKIMQLTDIHIGGGWMSTKKDADAINAVASMITAEKPDLVIVTGDIAFPVPFISGTLNNLHPARLFAELMETLEVYWIPTFGNHDTELYSFYSREDISDFYAGEEFKYCLYEEGENGVDGYGNSAIYVKSLDGIITKPLIMMDSHSYTDNDFLGILWKYDNLHDNQIEWYKSSIESVRARNAETVGKLYSDPAQRQAALDRYGNTNALIFFHIPLREYDTAWKEFAANGYKDTNNVKRLYGYAGEKDEAVLCGVGEDNMFETISTLGGDAGIFCGHDHLNGFSMDYKGVRLTYGMSIDFLAYSGISKLGAQRGCTIITVHPDGSFENSAENYYQDKYEILSGGEKEAVTMQDFK